MPHRLIRKLGQFTTLSSRAKQALESSDGRPRGFEPHSDAISEGGRPTTST